MNTSNAFLQDLVAHMPTLRAFGRSLCADMMMADDLVQETLLKAWNHRYHFQPGSNMRAWLVTILRNQYYSELRHRKHEVEDPDGEHATRMAVQPQHEMESELDAMTRALWTLPREQREALLLVCANGLTYQQAATACSCAVGTIKSRIARGRDQLATLFGLDRVQGKTATEQCSAG
jgi:RNA polymerase sigma-70 factor (ECF subfamily)